MADLLQAKYDELEQIAASFHELAARAKIISNSLSTIRADLQGEWEGYGSDQFMIEMDGEILPAMVRLDQALASTASLVTTIKEELYFEDEQGGILCRLFGWFCPTPESPPPPSPSPTPAPTLPPPPISTLPPNPTLPPEPPLPTPIPTDPPPAASPTPTPSPTPEPVTSPYGEAQSPLFGEQGMVDAGYDFGEPGEHGTPHYAVDLAPAGVSDADVVGTPVQAIFSGPIYVDPDDPYRVYLILQDHPDTVVTYSHIDTSTLNVDENGNGYVNHGDQLGTIMDITDDPYGDYTDETPNHVHIGIGPRVKKRDENGVPIPFTEEEQQQYDIRPILGLPTD